MRPISGEFDSKILDRPKVDLELSQMPSRKEITDPIKIKTELLKARYRFVNFLISKTASTRLPEKVTFEISWQALVDTLGLTDIRPKITKTEIDRLVRAVLPTGVIYSGNLYRIENLRDWKETLHNWFPSLIIKTMSRAPNKTYSYRKLGDRLGVHWSTLHKYLQNLLSEGKITSTKPGIYRLSTPTKTPENS